MIKLVAFDLDGTIGDTLPMCIQAFKEATQPYAGRELSDEEVVQTFGLNEEGMIRCVVDEAYQQQALHDFYLIYKTLHKTMCPEPFEGIRELITLLKQNGIIVVLITGKEKLRYNTAAIQYGKLLCKGRYWKCGKKYQIGSVGRIAAYLSFVSR